MTSFLVLEVGRDGVFAGGVGKGEGLLVVVKQANTRK